MISVPPHQVRQIPRGGQGGSRGTENVLSVGHKARKGILFMEIDLFECFSG